MQTAPSYSPPDPSSLFTRSVAANIAYWQQRTKILTDADLPAIDRDRQNLYRAAKYGLHLADTWRETAVLLLQTYALVERRGYWGEWIPLLESLIERCGADDLALRGRLLDQLGLFYRYNQQLEKAAAAHQEELKIGLALADKWRQAHASINLGAVLRLMRRFVAAEASILQAQAAFQAIDAPTVKHAFVMLELGLLAQAQGQLAVAEAQFKQSVQLWREVGDPALLANCLKLLGQILSAQNKTAVAASTYHEALDLLTHTENYLDKARVLNELGVLHLHRAAFGEAYHYLMAADAALNHQTGNFHIQAVVATNFGTLYLAQDQLTAAEQAFQHSISLWQIYADQVQYANALGGLAEVKMKQGDRAAARQLYLQAVDLLADYPDDAWGQKLQTDFAAALNTLNQL